MAFMECLAPTHIDAGALDPKMAHSSSLRGGEEHGNGRLDTVPLRLG